MTDATTVAPTPSIACPADQAFLTQLIDAQASISNAGLDAEVVVRTIIEQAQRLCGGEGALFEVIDGDEMVCTDCIGSLSHCEGLRFARTGSLAAHAIAERRAMVSDDAAHDRRVNRGFCDRAGLGSFIVVPLLYNEQLMGLLLVGATRPRAFDALHAAGLQMIAGMLAAKLAQAEMFETHRRLLAERSAALDALRDSERRFRLLAETAPVTIYEADARGNTTFISERWGELTGMAVADSMGAGWVQAIHPDDRERAANSWFAASSAGLAYACEYRVVARDGRQAWVHSHATPVRDARGGAAGYIGTATNITDRKRREWSEVDRAEVLEMLTRGERLPAVLERVAIGVERQLDKTFAAIVLGNGGATPTDWVRGAMPEPLAAALRPFLPALARAAAAAGEGDVTGDVRVIDLSADPALRDFRTPAAVHGVRGCWVRPLRDAEANVLGWLLLCCAELRPPTAAEAQTIVASGRMASLVIDNRAKADRIAHAATHDPLTGLPNRATFYDRLARAISTGRRTTHPVGVLTLDVDRFKQVNDEHGHAAGDAVLAEFGRRLRGVLRESDTFARLGGDEFAAILPACNDDAGLATVARKLAEALSEPIALPGGRTLKVTTSVGGALCPAHGTTIASVLEAADRALYVVKQRGRDGFECATAPAALAA